MPYIFHSSNHFTLIDSTQKNGLFCQFFSSGYTPKPIQIYPQCLTDYSAHMDHNGKIYVAALPDAFHLNYYIYEGNRFTRYVLVSNSNSNYNLSSPIIYTLHNTPYIIYLSHQTHSTTYNFVQENLYQPHLVTLLTTYCEPTLIKSYILENEIYIFFITYDENYQLQLLRITDSQVASATYLSSSEPIVDYSVCIDQDILHITYVSELHGKYQLSYFNTQSRTVTSLATTQYPCNPIIFCYYNFIWINATINHKLQMLMSINNGQSFSLPAPCSIQNNIHRAYFSTHKDSPFIGQEIYAAITSNLKLCTLSMIDIPRFHPDSMIAPELELLLEGLVFALESTSAAPPTPIPTIQTPMPTPSRPAPNPSNPSPPSSPHNLNDAKSAFMNEMPGWDLPPRV